MRESKVFKLFPPEWRGGGHYSVNTVAPENAWELLRSLFPDGKADEMNWFVMSTSGVHGSYCTLDDLPELRNGAAEDDGPPTITFLVIQPRLVQIIYGNVPVDTEEEEAFLRGLVASSLDCIRETQTGNIP